MKRSEALKYRGYIEKSVDAALDDTEALGVVKLFPHWNKAARLQQRIEGHRRGPDLSILDDIFGKYNIQPGGDLKVDDEGRSGGAAAPCGG